MSKGTVVGLVATGAWILAGLGAIVGFWPRFSAMAPDAWGDFLLGFLAPVASLWLVIGYFRQGDAVRRTAEALRRQEEELAKQVAEIAALVRASEDRLDMERQVRRQRESEAKERRQPRFVPAGRESTPRFVAMRVRNQGGGAWKVRASLEGRSLNVRSGAYVAPGDELEVDLPQDLLRETGKLVFEYTDADQDREELSYYYDGNASFRPWGPHDWPAMGGGGWSPS